MFLIIILLFDNIILIKRYIYNCFVIYKGSESDFEAFVLYMNCLPSNLHTRWGSLMLIFLDTSISILDNQIVSSLYKINCWEQSPSYEEFTPNAFKTWFTL